MKQEGRLPVRACRWAYVRGAGAPNLRPTKAQALLAAIAPLKDQPLSAGIARLSSNHRDHGMGWWAKCEFLRPDSATLEPDEILDQKARRLKPNRTKFFVGRSRADAISKARHWAETVLQARAIYELP